MAKMLSESLAEMSAHAKQAEDHIAAAQKEAHDKIIARREESRATVEASIAKVNQDMHAVGSTLAEKWKAVQAKINADKAALKAGIAERKHERDVKHAENHAKALEMEASLAVDYAVASIDQAELAVYDAIVARAEADRKKAS
ncbi:hypothetical protein KEU06_27620 [Pseudaminobacter sp. 19-2017]|uniref:Uncharacterized protein n=1 Tax=Pseudaminobacter soli (ex Zhang et al. 2022) TaxID=2831468 RepID=A0A942E8G8_9HYPH|nr:hypothetical protein [Pseudaminobacter soli]MBS3652365.1 hypothetical protein [Pseudaminobacter soli]